MSWTIQYDQNRFPVLQLGPDGKPMCRGCGKDIPEGRSAWCSNPCYRTYHPRMVKMAVFRRDKGVCRSCQFDCYTALQVWKSSRRSWVGSREEWWALKPRKWEMHHIKPFSEGGLTILSNLITLCSKCHRRETSGWRMAKKQIAIRPDPA